MPSIRFFFNTTFPFCLLQKVSIRSLQAKPFSLGSNKYLQKCDVHMTGKDLNTIAFVYSTPSSSLLSSRPHSAITAPFSYHARFESLKPIGFSDKLLDGWTNRPIPQSPPLFQAIDHRDLTSPSILAHFLIYYASTD